MLKLRIEERVGLNNMKIIAIDNYNREIYSDVLICENINRYIGKIVVDYLNGVHNDGDSFYRLSVHKDSDSLYRLVEDDYELYKFEWLIY